jgi:hypothetical protein
VPRIVPTTHRTLTFVVNAISQRRDVARRVVRNSSTASGSGEGAHKRSIPIPRPAPSAHPGWRQKPAFTEISSLMSAWDGVIRAQESPSARARQCPQPGPSP